jgi:hypothetical protein
MNLNLLLFLPVSAFVLPVDAFARGTPCRTRRPVAAAADFEKRLRWLPR